MNPQRWEAVGELFDKALSLPVGERTACVERESAQDDELRREVMSLIASHKAAPGGFVQEKIKNAVLSFHEVKVSEVEATHVGPYRLVRELGRGGMGTVYLAERDDQHYKSTVAIKLVRPGMDTDFVLARFRRERQTLARLQHPNVARLLDGGTTSNGLPYIVMEYIDGLPITAYAEKHNLNIEHRVRLFLQVCYAVDYAHRNFVIHRDLKPGNILVDASGNAKLLDFGICKLLSADPPAALAGSETITGLMTPNYASPEQVRGEAVALLSDIYSLGVVFYELLAGKRPHRPESATAYDLTRSIVEGTIQVPSTSVEDRSLARQLRGDLDNIVMHALETEPQRRYESAALLSDDLRRYLLHEPVLARPQTAGYRGYKFVQRHIREVAAICALFLALAAGLAGSLRQQMLADARLAQVRELASKLVFDVHDAVQDLPGATPARKVIVQTAITYLDSAAASVKGDARAERELASAYRRLGDVQGNVAGSSLGDTASALVSYQKARALLEDSLRRNPRDIAGQTERLVVYQRIGSMQAYAGKLSDAAQTLQSAISNGAPLAGTGDNAFKAALADLYIESGDAKRNGGDYIGSLKDASEGLRLYREIQASGTATTAMLQSLATAYSTAGMAEGKNGRLQEALENYRAGTAIMEKLVASEPQNASLRRDLMLAYGHVGDVSGNPNVENLGDRTAAVQAYQRAAAIGKQIYEADPSNERAGVDYGIVLSRIATAMDDHDLKVKAAAHNTSLEVLKKVALTSPNDLSIQVYIAYGAQQLGDTLRTARDWQGAERAYSQANAVAEAGRKSGQISFSVLALQSDLRLAQVEVARGDRTRALAYARRGFDVSTNLPQGAKSPFMSARGPAVMGLTYAALTQSPLRQAGDHEQALHWLHKSRDAWNQLRSNPNFSAPYLREVKEVESALAALEPR
jgi:tetratricopeptide (TPR) repeat protein/tRNA A-37 threonylcarbamoyl transferase component Bud32